MSSARRVELEIPAGGGEHEPPHERRMALGEPQRDDTAERVPEHVRRAVEQRDEGVREAAERASSPAAETSLRGPGRSGTIRRRPARCGCSSAKFHAEPPKPCTRSSGGPSPPTKARIRAPRSSYEPFLEAGQKIVSHPSRGSIMVRSTMSSTATRRDA